MRRFVGVLGLATLGLAGVFGGVFLPSSGATTAKTDATTRITVKASEFKYVLSRRSAPTGTIVFTVKNTGKISHDFKIAGKKTAKLAPGKSQVLRVVIKKKGTYSFVCTLLGHAGAGMKGKLGVGTAAPKPTPTPTTTSAPPPPPPPPTPTGTLGNANTTVQVSMFEYGYTLSQASIPSGQVTFVIKNNGSEVHNFSITGTKAGTLLNPGQTETYTVALPPSRYNYVCDVPFHIDRGMLGSFAVTQ